MTRYRCDGCGNSGFSVKLCSRCGGSDTCLALVEEPSITLARYLTHTAALDVAAGQRAARYLTALLTGVSSVELGARAAHAAYVEHSRNLGHTSRRSADGEEQLVSYDALSPAAQSYDRVVARAVIGAILGVDVELEQLLREEEMIERRAGKERKLDLEAVRELWSELTDRSDPGDRGDLLCRLYGLEEGDDPSEILFGLLTDVLAAADRYQQPVDELLSEVAAERRREMTPPDAQCVRSIAIDDDGGEIRVIFKAGTPMQQAALALWALRDPV